MISNHLSLGERDPYLQTASGMLWLYLSDWLADFAGAHNNVLLLL